MGLHIRGVPGRRLTSKNSSCVSCSQATPPPAGAPQTTLQPQTVEVVIDRVLVCSIGVELPDFRMRHVGE
ncbi:unnamed protein product [Amoebophrya sp. A120]|nr:unnamed protein product [Amoebophrya sp. A120]|eukprot:GSA120T00001592001.1